jgi:hypothetical protein
MSWAEFAGYLSVVLSLFFAAAGAYCYFIYRR